MTGWQTRTGPAAEPNHHVVEVRLSADVRTRALLRHVVSGRIFAERQSLNLSLVGTMLPRVLSDPGDALRPLPGGPTTNSDIPEALQPRVRQTSPLLYGHERTILVTL